MALMAGRSAGLLARISAFFVGIVTISVRPAGAIRCFENMLLIAVIIAIAENCNNCA